MIVCVSIYYYDYYYYYYKSSLLWQTYFLKAFFFCGFIFKLHCSQKSKGKIIVHILSFIHFNYSSFLFCYIFGIKFGIVCFYSKNVTLFQTLFQIFVLYLFCYQHNNEQYPLTCTKRPSFFSKKKKKQTKHISHMLKLVLGHQKLGNCVHSRGFHFQNSRLLR